MTGAFITVTRNNAFEVNLVQRTLPESKHPIDKLLGGISFTVIIVSDECTRKGPGLIFM